MGRSLVRRSVLAPSGNVKLSQIWSDFVLARRISRRLGRISLCVSAAKRFLCGDCGAACGGRSAGHNSLARALVSLLRNGSLSAKAGWLLIAAGAVLGIILIKTGTLAKRVEQAVFPHHHFTRGRGSADSGLVGQTAPLGIGYGIEGGRRRRPSRALFRICWRRLAMARVTSAEGWESRNRIANPDHASRHHGRGRRRPAGLFFPSSAQVYGKQKIPSKFFMESDSCKRCHEDIYNQWYSSAHHFSSFNNQWYRKSIEYMQDTIGTKPSKWCGGCHDPAVLYAGLMDTPIKQIVHRPEAQAGLGCMMCHSIADVKSTMGQGDFYLEYPKLHELAATQESGRARACMIS